MLAQGRYIDRKTLRDFSALSSGTTAFAIISDWLLIFAAIIISEWSGNWLIYLVSIVFIAGRMHALGVLVHDFAHYRFISNKRLSEWIGDVFLAWPILITVDGYRTTHLAHHIHTNTEDDPDFVAREGTSSFSFPKTKKAFFVHLIGYIFVWRTIQDIIEFHTKKIAKKTSLINTLIRVCYYLGIIFLMWYFGLLLGFFLYWIVPFTTIFFLIMYIRAVAEHFCDMDYSKIETGTRTVIPLFWERLFFSPHNVNYHIEHHIYPGVPFYQLPKLHQHLMKDPNYVSNAHITYGYTTGLLRECFESSTKVGKQFQTRQHIG